MVLAAGVAVNFTLASEPVSSVERASAFEQCLTSLMERGSALTFVELELATADCASTSLSGISSIDDAQGVVREIFDRRTSSGLIRERCHDSAHAFGVSFFDQWGASALIPGLEECGFGFYHGLMMAVGASLDAPSAARSLMEFCRVYASTSPGQEANFDFCSHGIGHAFGSRVSTSEALELCSSGPLVDLPSRFPMGHKYSWSVNCFTGALNEQLRYAYWDGTALGSADEVLGHCAGLRDGYQLVCTSYSLHYSAIPIEGIRELCPTFSGPSESGCWWAVGFRGGVLLFDSRRDASAERFLRGARASSVADDPELVARFVDRLCQGDISSACAERFAFEAVQNSQDPVGMRAVCAALSVPAHAAECAAAVSTVTGLQGV